MNMEIKSKETTTICSGGLPHCHGKNYSSEVLISCQKEDCSLKKNCGFFNKDIVETKSFSRLNA